MKIFSFSTPFFPDYKHIRNILAILKKKIECTKVVGGRNAGIISIIETETPRPPPLKPLGVVML